MTLPATGFDYLGLLQAEVDWLGPAVAGIIVVDLALANVVYATSILMHQVRSAAR